MDAGNITITAICTVVNPVLCYTVDVMKQIRCNLRNLDVKAQNYKHSMGIIIPKQIFNISISTDYEEAMD
eukprot:9506690-Ditylum_brightwellii.AAC.1